MALGLIGLQTTAFGVRHEPNGANLREQ
jgi:hypothetical protein